MRRFVEISSAFQGLFGAGHEAGSDGEGQSVAQWIVTTLLIAAAYAALWVFSGLFQYTDFASMWFAPHGLLVAVLLLFKRDGVVKAWLAIALLPLFVSLLGRDFGEMAGSLGQMFLQATVAALSYWLAVELFRYIELRWGRVYPHDVLLPIIFAVVLLGAALMAGMLGMLLHMLAGDSPTSAVNSMWLARWLGNFIGIMTLTPLLVFLGYRFFSRWIDPYDTMLCRNARANVPVAGKSDALPWAMTLLLASMPFILALSRVSMDPKIPVSFLFFLSIIPMAVLAISQNWAATVTGIALMAAASGFAVGEGGSGDDLFAYQANALVITVFTLFLYEFVRMHQMNSRRLEYAISIQEELKQNAFLDPLTGVYNRRAVGRTFQHLLDQSGQANEVFGVIVLDIDNFKTINDTLGQDAGDRVLVKLTEAIKRCTRPQDVCVRWGGDEFLVFAQVPARDKLELLASHLRSEIELCAGDMPLPVSCSIGVTLWRAGDFDLSMIKRADAAMFQAKRQGRNQVCMA